MHEMLFRSMNMRKFVYGSGCVHKITTMLAVMFFFSKSPTPSKIKWLTPNIELFWLGLFNLAL